LGSGVSALTGRVIAGKTLGSQALGIGSRALLNGGGSGVIGGGVTLAQNAFKKAILHQNIGLLDGVEDNARLSATLGALGSSVGDLIEIGGGASNMLYKQFLQKQAWERMTLEQRLMSTSNAIYRCVKSNNTWSTVGTTISNAVANSGPTLSIFSKQNTNPQNTNQEIKKP
jgi:hypothetical protein